MSVNHSQIRPLGFGAASGAVNVRTAAPKDTSVISQLYQQYLAQTQDKVDQYAVHNYVSDRLRSNDTRYLIATQGDKAVGFVQLFKTYSAQLMRPVWYASDVFTTRGPLSKNNTVFTGLIDQAKAFAEGDGTHRLRLKTPKPNIIVQNLLKSMDFTLAETSNKAGYFEWKGKKADSSAAWDGILGFLLRPIRWLWATIRSRIWPNG